jgi:flagellin
VAFSKSIEKLSSGLRINRAGDDAAGLSISEKLRAQVRGLDQAVRNAQDGISMVQTTEGSLTQVQSILQRMRELGVQGSNGTLSSDDRKAIGSELTQLKSEIDRIANVTDFNGTKLLAGLAATANVTSASSPTVAAGAGTASGFVTASKDVGLTTAQAGTYTVTVNSLDANNMVNSVNVLGPGAGAVAQTYVLTGTGAAGTVNIGNGLTFSFSTAAVAANVGSTFSITAGAGTLGTVGATSAKLQIGANTSTFESLTLSVAGVGSAYIGDGTQITNLSGNMYAAKDLADAVGQVTTMLTSNNFGDVSSAMRALVDSSSQALNDISTVRGSLGASQNRLENTIANLGVASENLAASESRIRDVDMAKEMVNYTKTQILQQAGTSILAQANQSSQSVLALLR